MSTCKQEFGLRKAGQAVSEKNEKLFLIVDQGGHASRAVIMDGSGNVLARAERPLGTLRPREGYVEHDPEELVLTVSQCLTEVMEKNEVEAGSLSSAGMATQRSSIVCWDSRTGEALSPVISWQDTRSRSRIDELASRSEWVHGKTGLFLSAHYGASKFQWCLENIEGVRKAEKSGRLCMGPMSSYIVWRLTVKRRFAVDPVSASRTLLWNISKLDWDQDLLEVFKVPQKALPVCVPTVHAYGKLRAGNRHLPLTLVTGDQSAALFAHGRLRSDTAYVNMGTGAFVSRLTGEKPLFQNRLLTSIVHEQDGVSHNVLEGTINGAGSALAWIRDDLAVKDMKDRLPAWLRKAKDPPLFLNGVSGLGAPYWDPDFESVFVGKGQTSEKVVAVVESIAFLIHTNLLQMQRSLSLPGRIQLTGGLSTLDGLCQRLADLTRIRVYRPAQTEATVRGTCYLLAGQPACWPEAEPGVWFEPGSDQPIASRYERWVEEMEKRVRGDG